MNRYFPWNIVLYQLYLYQLEEYEDERYLNALKNKGLIPPKSLRKKVIFTKKILLIVAIAILIKGLVTFAFSYIIYSLISINPILFLAIFLLIFTLSDLIYFAFALQAAWVLKPFENLAKQDLLRKAKNKLHNLDSLTIIGITGSYGKTTMKEVLKTVLEEKFKVVATKGNNNTPIGVARTILNNVSNQTEILIVEMGEYKKGDVAEICKLTPPHISIVTGINEAHLERYGSMENAISTKFEICQFTQPNPLILLNADDELTKANYHKYIPNINNIKFFSAKNDPLSTFKSQNLDFDDKKPGVNFDLKIGEEVIENIQTNFISDYIVGYASAATMIGLNLQMSSSQIKFTLSKIKPFEHRLEPKWNANHILIIDDTYNGNSNGIKEGIEVLKKFKDKRKVYVTPGLVETGSATKEIHLEIGHWLAKVADLIVLTKNSVTPFIFEGLIEAGFNKDNIVWFETSKETYQNLYTLLKPDDVVLMQNDWSDNYY